MRHILGAVWLVVGLAAAVSAQTVSADRVRLNAGPVTLRSGSGSPEGVVVGAVGDSYYQTDSPFSIWRKLAGAGTTGWSILTVPGSALTRTDDTNITLTLGGTPATALLQPASISLGWTGTLAAARLNANVVQAITNDTNVTGSISAQALTLGWAGTLAAPRGGTGQSSYTVGDLLYAPTTSSVGKLAAAAAGQVLASAGASTAPAYTAAPALTSIGGAANLTLNPAGDLITDPVGNDILPNLPYDINLGMLSKKYLTLHAAELWVETLVAQNTIATIGGRVLVAPTNVQVIDLAPGDTAITVKYNNFANGDRVYMEADGKVEWMALTSGAGASGSNWIYNVTRNLDGTGANQWYAGDAVVSTGTTGNGFIDVYSIAGVGASGAGPSIVGNVRTGTTYSAYAPRWAIGNLNGLYNYGADTYGAAFGDASATNVTVDATNGFRIRSGTTNKLVADTSGNLSIVGDLSIGTAGVLRSGATAYGTGTGYWLDYNSGTPRFRVGTVAGNRFAWDGTDVTLVSNTVQINTSGIAVAPNTSAGYTAARSYQFAPLTASNTGDGLGVFAYDPSGGTRAIRVGATADNAAPKAATAELFANSNTSLPNQYALLALSSPVSPATSLAALYATNITLDAGAVQIGGSLNGAGTLNIWNGLSNRVVIDANLLMKDASAVTKVSLNSSSGDLAINTNKFTVAGATGNTLAAGTLSTGGDITLNSAGNAALTVKAVGTSNYAQLLYSQGATTAWNVYAGNVAAPPIYWADGGGNVEMSLTAAGLLTVSGGAAINGGNLSFSGGGPLPTVDSTHSVGTASFRFALVRATTITAGDLGFENDWALTESYKLGIEEPGIALVDDKGELIAFFGRAATYAKPWADIDTLAYATTTAVDRAAIDATPELRVKGYQQVRRSDCTPDADARPPVTCIVDGPPIYKTRGDAPAAPSGPRQSNRDRRKP